MLSLSHGNSDPEHGFSINKQLLNIHGYSLGEDTIEAIRIVKGGIQRQGGVNSIKELLVTAKNARQKYHADLEEKQKLNELEEKKRIETEKEKAAAQTKTKLAEDIDQFDADLNMLKTGISVAEQSITEGNTDLGACLSQKKISREDIQRVQSKIEMGIKCKAEL